MSRSVPRSLRIAFAIGTPLFLARTPRPAALPDLDLPGRGPVLPVLTIGSGLAVGYGVQRPDDALPARVASALAARTGRAVLSRVRVRPDVVLGDLPALATGDELGEAGVVLLCPALSEVVRAGDRRWMEQLDSTVLRLRAAMRPAGRLVLLGLPMTLESGVLGRSARRVVASANSALAAVPRHTPHVAFVAAPGIAGARAIDSGYTARCAARIADAVLRDALPA